jgi:hypothetical protein
MRGSAAAILLATTRASWSASRVRAGRPATTGRCRQDHQDHRAAARDPRTPLSTPYRKAKSNTLVKILPSTKENIIRAVSVLSMARRSAGTTKPDREILGPTPSAYPARRGGTSRRQPDDRAGAERSQVPETQAEPRIRRDTTVATVPQRFTKCSPGTLFRDPGLSAPAEHRQ